ncbi:hypothetical protein Tco_0944271 [Tanacetum coccineum]
MRTQVPESNKRSERPRISLLGRAFGWDLSFLRGRSNHFKQWKQQKMRSKSFLLPSVETEIEDWAFSLFYREAAGVNSVSSSSPWGPPLFLWDPVHAWCLSGEAGYIFLFNKERSPGLWATATWVEKRPLNIIWTDRGYNMGLGLLMAVIFWAIYIDSDPFHDFI